MNWLINVLINNCYYCVLISMIVIMCATEPFFSFMHKLLTIPNSFLPSGTVNSSNATCELWGIRNKNPTQGTGSQRRGHGTRPIKMQPSWRKRPRQLCQGHRTAQRLWRQVTLVKATWLSRASLMEQRIRNCAHHFQVRAVGTIFC